MENKPGREMCLSGVSTRQEIVGLTYFLTWFDCSNCFSSKSKNQLREQTRVEIIFSICPFFAIIINYFFTKGAKEQIRKWILNVWRNENLLGEPSVKFNGTETTQISDLFCHSVTSARIETLCFRRLSALKWNGHILS